MDADGGEEDVKVLVLVHPALESMIGCHGKVACGPLEAGGAAKGVHCGLPMPTSYHVRLL